MQINWTVFLHVLRINSGSIQVIKPGIFRGRNQFPSRKGKLTSRSGGFTSAGGRYPLRKGHPALLSGNITSTRGTVPSRRGNITSARGIHPLLQCTLHSASGNHTFSSGNYPLVQKKQSQCGPHSSLCVQGVPQARNRTQDCVEGTPTPFRVLAQAFVSLTWRHL
jgi:hypothetical protein